MADNHAIRSNCSLWTNVSGTWGLDKTYVNIGRLDYYDVLLRRPRRQMLLDRKLYRRRERAGIPVQRSTKLNTTH
jgi:hypothetical protein